MAWAIRTATDFRDALAQVRAFTQKEYFITDVDAGANTGDGDVRGASASDLSAVESWELFCTAGGGNGEATFSVTGSVSGARATATCGVPYSIDEVSFCIVGGSTDYVYGDHFTVVVDSGTAEWVEDRWDTDRDGNGNYELIQHGIGGGSDEIYAAYYTASNFSTYWNWGIGCLTGYVDGNSLGNQPGWSPISDCMNNASFTFYIIHTARHIKVIPLAASVHGGSYVGWMLPLATPSQWTYPAFVGGSAYLNNQLIGSYDSYHSCYWDCASSNYPTGKYLDITTWKTVPIIYPRHYGYFQNHRPNLVTGEIELYPATIASSGILEGVYYPTPYVPAGGLLTAGDVVITPTECAVCFNNVNRSAAGNLIAMDLMGDS